MTADPRLARITQTALKLERLRKQRDELIRALDLPLRDIAQAAGLSPEGVRLIKLKGEQT